MHWPVLEIVEKLDIFMDNIENFCSSVPQTKEKYQFAQISGNAA